MRAQVTAAYLLVVNIAGLTAGPTSVALLTDRVFGSDAAVGWSMAIVSGVTIPAGAIILRRAARVLVAARRAVPAG
jgi:hypothetical protein